MSFRILSIENTTSNRGGENDAQYFSCMDLTELRGQELNNYKSKEESSKNVTKGFIDPSSSLQFRYAFVFRSTTSDENVFELDLTFYTKAWIGDDDIPCRETILRATCCLLLFVHDRWKNGETLTSQMVTFVNELNTERLLKDIRDMAAAATLSISHWQPVMCDFVTYIPIPTDYQTTASSDIGVRLNAAGGMIGRYVENKRLSTEEENSRRFVKNGSNEIIGFTCNYSRNLDVKAYERPVFTVVMWQSINRNPDTTDVIKVSLSENTDLRIADCFLRPIDFDGYSSEYSRVFREWIKMIVKVYITPNKDRMVYLEKESTSVNISSNPILSLRYRRGRAEMKHHDIELTLVHDPEDRDEAKIQRYVKFSNTLRSSLEYIFRRVSDKIMYVVPVDITVNYPRMKFEINRMSWEIENKALIENSSIIRLVDFKIPCLRPTI